MNDIARKILFPSVPVDTRVHRAWDIGFSDAVTVTWFCGDKTLLEQTFHGRALPEVAALVKAQPFDAVGNDYVRPEDNMPWLGRDKSVAETMIEVGLNPVPVTPHG